MNIQAIREKHKWYNVNWFKTMAPVYDVVEFVIAPLREKVAQRVVFPKAMILDLACGTGNQSFAFARHGHSVVGIDLSPHMLKKAERKVRSEYDIAFLNQDACELSYADSTFDVASISFGLHDMPEEIGIAILKEIIRVTKPNGQIIIVDYSTPTQSLSQHIGNVIAKLWESRNYDHFRQTGLQHYLNQVHLERKNVDTYLFNNVQIVECENKK